MQREMIPPYVWLWSPFFPSSAPAASTGGFSFGSALGAAAAPPAAAATATPSLGLGGLFAQKPAGGLSFNTPAQANTIPQAQFAPGMKIDISGHRLGSDLTANKQSTDFLRIHETSTRFRKRLTDDPLRPPHSVLWSDQSLPCVFSDSAGLWSGVVIGLLNDCGCDFGKREWILW